MPHAFMSAEWFEELDKLIASAGDLEIPPEILAAEINITVTSTRGDQQAYLNRGVITRGHKADAPTSLTLDEALARKIFVDGDMTAGVQAFLAGEMKADGDLAQLVAMTTVEPSKEQKALTKKIAAFTA